MNRIQCLYHFTKVNTDVIMWAGPFPVPSILSGNAPWKVGSSTLQRRYWMTPAQSALYNFSLTNVSCCHEEEACIACKNRLQVWTTGKVWLVSYSIAGWDICVRIWGRLLGLGLVFDFSGDSEEDLLVETIETKSWQTAAGCILFTSGNDWNDNFWSWRWVS